MAQDTDVKNLIINKLTRAQYESIANPDPTQLYFITDEVISSSDVVNALGYTPENVANKTTTLSSSSTDTQYPSAKAVYDQIANIDTLPSQTGQSGKFLTTDGTDASWGNLPVATASTVGVVKPDNASIRVESDGTISAICRNIGEIVQSTLPLTDAGLHLLDGTLLQYGIYQEFIDYIADLYTENPTANYFTDETTWQASVTQYGSCGKFVYDSTNNTVRLPKITGIIEGTTDATALGDLIEAGLPNITGEFRNYGWNSSLIVDTAQSGAFYRSGTSRPLFNGSAGGGSGYKDGISIDASRSSSIYGNSNTVQPQTIKVLYYIVIANSSKTDIQVDIDNIATDLNGKADTDLTNTTDSAKVMMSGMGMPSDKFINLTLGASGSTYIAPANGYFVIKKRTTSTTQYLYMTSPELPSLSSAPINGQVLCCSVKVAKGENVLVTYTAGGETTVFRFYYAQGSESEAQ